MKDLDFLKKGIIAHRGIFDNRKVPENSIKAFKNALNKGYAIELDIRLTKDNKIVVFHDDVLGRMTKKKGNIKNLTFEELQKIKLINTDYTIPSLDEVLSLVNGKVPLLIELKSSSRSHRLEKELIKKLDEYKGEFAVQSFNPFIISYFRFHKKEYIRGLLVSYKKYKSFGTSLSIKLSKPDFLSVSKRMYKNKKIIKYRKKIPVFAWTIDSKDDVKKYQDCFDNLICNINDIA